MYWVQIAGKVTIYGKKIDEFCQFNEFCLYRQIVNYLRFKRLFNMLISGTKFVYKINHYL